MSKRNVTYMKPQEPSFLRRMKEQIGYREGPTVDTKRQKLEDLSGSDNDSDYEGVADPRKVAVGEREDEKPQVVVLSEGDLTAEQADAEKVRLAKEEREKPADLNQRIIFKAKHKPTKDIESGSGSVKSSIENKEKTTETERGEEKQKRNKKSKHTPTAAKLSFNQDDDEAEEY